MKPALVFITETPEASQACLQQIAESGQTLLNVHYRDSRDHTGMLGTTQAEEYIHESRYASFRTICCSIQDAEEMLRYLQSCQ